MLFAHPFHTCLCCSILPVRSLSCCAVQDCKQGRSTLLQHRLLKGKWGVAQARQDNKLEEGPPVCKWAFRFRVQPYKMRACLDADRVWHRRNTCLRSRTMTQAKLNAHSCPQCSTTQTCCFCSTILVLEGSTDSSPSSACCWLDGVLLLKFCNTGQSNSVQGTACPSLPACYCRVALSG